MILRERWIRARAFLTSRCPSFVLELDRLPRVTSPSHWPSGTPRLRRPDGKTTTMKSQPLLAAEVHLEVKPGLHDRDLSHGWPLASPPHVFSCRSRRSAPHASFARIVCGGVSMGPPWCGTERSSSPGGPTREMARCRERTVARSKATRRAVMGPSNQAWGGLTSASLNLLRRRFK